MGYIKDNYQTIKQFFKDVKSGINDIGLRLDGLESRREDVFGGGLTQAEENGKEYKAGEGILITDDDSVVLNYNGPFAYHLDHIDTTTTTTLWVTRSVGYVVRNGVRKTVYANPTPASMASGESAWMLYNTDVDSYSISIQTNAPTATSDKICVKLAENVNGVLRQIQFGEVVVVATGSGLSATVSDGGTATVEISGSTALVIESGANIQITGGANGELIISATGGGGGGLYPDLSNPLGDIVFDVTHEAYPYPVWLIGSIGVDSSIAGNVVVCDLVVGGYGVNVYAWSDSPPTGTLYVPFSFLIPANKTFELSTISSGAPTDLHGNVTIYPCIGYTPPGDYTVSSASGTNPGSLFYGLSTPGTNNVLVDSSLDGTPIDFEGASVL